MKIINSIFYVFFIFFLFEHNANANTYFLDFKSIIEKSEAGKKANQILKNELDQGIKRLKKTEIELQNEEKNVIKKKNILSAEEYKKQITSLRKKVSALQKERKKTLEAISKKRDKIRKKLLKEINPILKNYMVEKNIRIVIDKKSVLLGDDTLDITSKVLELLNQKLKNINFN